MTVHTIITESLYMRKICTKLFLISFDRRPKLKQCAYCEDLMQRVQTDPEFFDNLTVGDEMWVFEPDPEKKH